MAMEPGIPERMPLGLEMTRGAVVRMQVTGLPRDGGTVPVAVMVEGQEAIRGHLVVRRGDPPVPGEQLEGWVMEVDPHALLVTVDQFGRLPISDRMRPRYQQAVAETQRLIAGESPSVTSLEGLSELKGMLNRVVRRDQRDWLSVSETLGHPDSSKLRDWVRAIVTVRSALAKGELADLEPLQTDLEFQMALQRADTVLSGRREATSSKPRLASASRVLGPREPSGRLVYLRGAETQARLDRANRTHEDTRLALAAELRRRGFEPGQDQLIDLYCALPSGFAIYEVKSINEANWRSQVRRGASQLKEYRFLRGLTGAASLYLVLSDKLPEEWVLDLLVAEYDIGALWWSGGRFEGPAARSALGGGYEQSPDFPAP